MLSILLSITIMSFNLRNGNANDGTNSWPYRAEACANLVIDRHPDIVGFQENTLPQDTFFTERLTDYDHVAVGRELDNPTTETNAIYFRRDRFTLLRTNTFWLSETPDVCSRGWDGKYPRVATYVLLEDRNTSEHYLVLNTHLDHRGVQARFESMALVSDTIRALLASSLTPVSPSASQPVSLKTTPVFLLGDLNVRPTDPALTPVRQHMLSAQEVCKDNDDTFHGWAVDGSKGKIIDYIFYRNDYPTSFSVIHDGYGVPFVSDHYPIIATFLDENEAVALENPFRERKNLETRTSDWNKFYRYADQNDSIRALMAADRKYRNTVVFYGNSITQNWYRQHPSFFTSHGFLGRGIGGQTSSHLLCRFREDVLDLQPKIVMLMVGTNDLAQNNGLISEKHIMDNIRSMVELARLHHVTPVICSVLPARRFRWNRVVSDAPERIVSLNDALRRYAAEQHLLYVDYYSAMVDADGGLRFGLHKDEVHPTDEGYDVMEPIALEALRKLGVKF